MDEAYQEVVMDKKQTAILILTVLGAMAGVFLGAGADATWDQLSQPIYIIGSLVSGAAAGVAFLSKPPTLRSHEHQDPQG